MEGGSMPKAKRGRAQHIVEIEPTRERRVKGAIERLVRPIEDCHGAWSRPLKAVDTLSAMMREGSIGFPERQAGERFHDLFRLAHFDGLFASDTTRIPVILANGANGRGADGNEAARLQILCALDALGGIQSPGGSCAWYVLGCELPLTRWAIEVGWSGRRVSRLAASGVLLTDLGILRGYWHT
jgi:hypothetical protein